MPLKNSFKSLFESSLSFINNLPKKHFFALIILFVLILVIAFIPTAGDKQSRKVIDLSLLDKSEGAQAKIPAEQPATPVKSRDRVVNITIKSGDTLSAIFQEQGLTTQLQALLDVDIDYLYLGNVQPRQTLSFILSPKNKLLSLKLTLDKSASITYLWKDNEYIAIEETKESIWQNQSHSGKISSNFISSAKDANLSIRQAYQVIHALSEKINFNRDLLIGDKFKVLVAKQYIEGEYTHSSEVLAVVFSTRRYTYSAFLHDDGRYYDKNGKGLGKAYRRRPVNGKWRISSSFNPNRLHPVLKKRIPHNGTDFAIPRGTKVYATGDGIVLRSLYHYAAGNYIVIKNSRRYKTRFLHLSKSYVKKGQRVKMGQLIGLSGNTGRSTGPHLHFEFRVDGKPVDAMKINLPLSSQVPKKQLTEFYLKRDMYLKEMGATNAIKK